MPELNDHEMSEAELEAATAPADQQEPAQPEVHVTPRVLPNLDAAARLARLEEENARLRAQVARQAHSKITLKVSEKGALSIYGMGRFPITHYASQWRTLLSNATMISEFLRDHAGELAEKE